MNQERFDEGPDSNLWFAESKKIGKSRKTAFLVLGAVFTAILLSGGVAGADKRPDNLGSGKDPGQTSLTSASNLEGQTQPEIVNLTRADFPDGNSPSGVKTDDFNKDGNLDLATAAYLGDVSIKLGDGQGGLSDAPIVDVGVNPVDIVTADFNGDDKPDLATTNQGPDTLSIRLGNGLGEFEVAPDVSVGGNPFGLVSGDFNNDSEIDLAAIATAADAVSVRLGAGDGTFIYGGNYEAGINPKNLSVGDTDNDGDPNLWVATNGAVGTDGQIVELKGDGEGSFGAPIVRASGKIYQAINTEGDFNADGKIDPVAVNGNHEVEILMNNGDGSFTSKVYSLGSGESPQDVIVTDLDGIGNPEIATTNVQSSRFTILRVGNDGVVTARQDEEGGVGNINLAGADFNDDGKQDIATANLDGDNVSLYKNNGAPAACSDGKDNDGDGETDFGSGSNNDPGCESSEDDNEVGTPELTVSDAQVTEGDTATTDAVFTVTRSGDTGGASSVAFDTEDGTATAPGDYEETSGSLTFASGEASKEIRVPVKGDTQEEPDEDFFVNLTNPTGATISDGRGKGTITDDD